MDEILKIELAGFEPPIAKYAEKLSGDKSYVMWGVDNKYPDYIKSLLSKSTIHSSIIQQKVRLIAGEGFIKPNDVSISFINNPFGFENLDEIVKKCTWDLLTFGGFALNVVWTKDRSKISYVNYIDIGKLRIDRTNDDDNVTRYWYSDGWENIQKYKPVLYDEFSTVNKKNASQIYFYKNYTPGIEYYPIPTYSGGINCIELESKMKLFHINSVERGFAPSMSIDIPLANGKTDEERREIVNKIKNQYQGSKNAGEVIVTFSDPNNPNIKTTFNKIDSNTSDERYKFLMDFVIDDICRSHNVTSPQIFGIMNSKDSELQGRLNLIEQIEYFQQSFVSPVQHTLESVFNELLLINYPFTQNKLSLQIYSPKFKQTGTSVKEITALLTSDLTPKQKYYLLISLDYDPIVAENLSGFDETATPTPSVTDKIDTINTNKKTRMPK